MRINSVSVQNYTGINSNSNVNFEGKLTIEKELRDRLKISDKYIKKWENRLPENSLIEVCGDANIDNHDRWYIIPYVDNKNLSNSHLLEGVDFFVLSDNYWGLTTEKDKLGNTRYVKTNDQKLKLTGCLIHQLERINSFLRNKRDKNIAKAIDDNMDQGVY